ncbi:uncharacterized protein OCT59_001152 [Rhizophagus irregularis]|uniref:uncharacterized protein n=1 Tax=Rhizophagus irregularis TaxID=588596 RepID=UPI000CB22B69|nr:hypothetical protein OCT59_001152 [Rhizophagus irregularis]GBC28853.1 hypothetical protein GLOIN_2v1786104 [Rhizophagus irregularis DAOM 181602=DAOM 197198]
MHTANLLDQLAPELIPFILKNLSIQDLKKCCSINNIWKDEVTREIRKRLIVECLFIYDKVTVKALIDPKSRYNSISKTLAQKIGLYITRIYGSEYPAVKDLGIGATNAGKKVMVRGWVRDEEDAGKKVMVRGWVRDEEVSISLPNIFELKPLSYVGKSNEHFLVVDKPEYDVVLGNNWLIRLGCRIDKRDTRYWENNEEKRLYYVRNGIDILSPPLYTFYELLFPNFTENNSDGEVIITKFIKHDREFDGVSEYYDSEYTETESSGSETESEDEYVYSNNDPLRLRYSD